MVTNFAHRMVGGQDFQAIVGAAQHRIRFLFWNCCPHYLKKLAHVCSLGDLVGRGWNQLTRLHRLVCSTLLAERVAPRERSGRAPARALAAGVA